MLQIIRFSVVNAMCSLQNFSSGISQFLVVWWFGGRFSSPLSRSSMFRWTEALEDIQVQMAVGKIATSFGGIEIAMANTKGKKESSLKSFGPSYDHADSVQSAYDEELVFHRSSLYAKKRVSLGSVLEDRSTTKSFQRTDTDQTSAPMLHPQSNRRRLSHPYATASSVPRIFRARSLLVNIADSEAISTLFETTNIARLDLRVGKIVLSQKHPRGDWLTVERIDVGEEKLRIVVSGLAKHIPMDTMQNRMVVVVCNIRPAKIKGILSEGMVLIASTAGMDEILEPPAGSQPGDRISFEGYPGTPDQKLNPRRKTWKILMSKLTIDANGVAVFDGSVPFTVAGKGWVTSPCLRLCPVK